MNVKFDDEVMKLVLDYRLKNSLSWARLRPEQARGVVSPAEGGMVETTTEEFTQLLAPEGPATGANAAAIEKRL